MITWTVDARKDLDQIRDYLLRHESPSLVIRVLYLIEKRINDLLIFPENAPLADKQKQMRKLIVSKVPYIVYYQVVSSDFRILAVIHTSRDFDTNSL